MLFPTVAHLRSYRQNNVHILTRIFTNLKIVNHETTLNVNRQTGSRENVAIHTVLIQTIGL